MLRPRALHASKGLLLLGIWGSRHGLLRMLWAKHRRLRVLWSSHRRLRTLRTLRTLRSRRTGLHILRLPLSLLILGRPLRVELRKLSRVHVGLVLVGAEDQVEGKQHQVVGKSYMDEEQRRRSPGVYACNKSRHVGPER